MVKNQFRIMIVFINKNLMMNQKQLMALSKKDLIEKCNVKQLDTKGTKFDLVKRLLTTSDDSIINTITHNTPVIIVEQDLQGHYVHRESMLVFDHVSEIVIGKKDQWNADKILPLAYNDIQNCLRYKFRYKMPENLAENVEIVRDKQSMKFNDENLHKRLLEIRNPTKNDFDDDEDDDIEEED